MTVVTPICQNPSQSANSTARWRARSRGSTHSETNKNPVRYVKQLDGGNRCLTPAFALYNVQSIRCDIYPTIKFATAMKSAGGRVAVDDSKKDLWKIVDLFPSCVSRERRKRSIWKSVEREPLRPPSQTAFLFCLSGNRPLYLHRRQVRLSI